MRKKVLMLVAVLTVAVVTGCGAPNWVQEGSGVHKGKTSLGIYGVGEGMSGVAPEVQTDLASINARAATDKATKEYSKNVLQDFVEGHSDWFKVDQVKNMGLYDKAAAQVAEKVLFRMQKVDQWKDSRGSEGEAGTMYLLRKVPLDATFFDTMGDTFKTVISENKNRILRVELDEVMQGLEKQLGALRQSPLGPKVAEMAEEEAQKAEEAAGEAAEEAADEKKNK